MEAFIAAVIVAAIPFLLAGTGELVAERTGVLNLGVEGMMLVGAVAGFAVALTTGSLALGALAGAGAGAALALIFAALTITLLANQPATGLALTIFGIGASGLIGQPFVGQPLGAAPLRWTGAEDLNALGRLALGQNALVYVALALAGLTAWGLTRTRLGLMLRAVGDSPVSADALGLRVAAIRYGATLFGGAMAGLAGAYLSTVYTPMWGENMTAGRGWIALALVVFAGWRMGRLALGALLFAAFTQLQFWGQGWSIGIPSQFLAMTPYLATIVALVLISRDARALRAHAPASLGRPFQPAR